MEHSPSVRNFWLCVQTIGWVVSLEGVVEFLTDRHSITLFRRAVAGILGRDPAVPRLPDSWEEWYNA